MSNCEPVIVIAGARLLLERLARESSRAGQRPTRCRCFGAFPQFLLQRLARQAFGEGGARGETHAFRRSARQCLARESSLGQGGARSVSPEAAVEKLILLGAFYQFLQKRRWRNSYFWVLSVSFSRSGCGEADTFGCFLPVSPSFALRCARMLQLTCTHRHELLLRADSKC